MIIALADRDSTTRSNDFDGNVQIADVQIDTKEVACTDGCTSAPISRYMKFARAETIISKEIS